MIQPSRSIEVRVAGQKFLLKTQADQATVDRVLEFVSQRLTQASHRSPHGVQSQQVALLALINLAEDYLNKEKSFESHQREIATLVDSISAEVAALDCPGIDC